MKPAICIKCGINLKSLVPDDAEGVVCFRCDQPSPFDDLPVDLQEALVWKSQMDGEGPAGLSTTEGQARGGLRALEDWQLDVWLADLGRPNPVCSGCGQD